MKTTPALFASFISLSVVAMQSPAAKITTHKASELPLETASLTAADVQRLKPVLEKIKVRMDDWPQINYYKKDNERIMQEKAPDVVFLGDSIFEYWNKYNFSNIGRSRTDGDGAPLFSAITCVNRGISAQTSAQLLLRLRADVIALKPKLMVLLCGANDIGANNGPMTLQETKDNIASMAELATLHKIKVALCSVLPVSDYHYDGKDPRGPQTVKRPLEKLCALNAWLKQYAMGHGHAYINYFDLFVDTNRKLAFQLSDDDIHPNAAGYALIEPLTDIVIRSILEPEDQLHRALNIFHFKKMGSQIYKE